MRSETTKLPVLHLPDRHGQFQLYLDTSKFATGSVLYQIQNGQPRPIAYASKRIWQLRIILLQTRDCDIAIIS